VISLGAKIGATMQALKKANIEVITSEENSGVLVTFDLFIDSIPCANKHCGIIIGFEDGKCTALSIKNVESTRAGQKFLQDWYGHTFYEATDNQALTGFMYKGTKSGAMLISLKETSSEPASVVILFHNLQKESAQTKE
jgi:hypothetical protein